MGNLKLGNIIYVLTRIYVNESMIIEPLVRLRGQKQFVCSVQRVEEGPSTRLIFFGEKRKEHILYVMYVYSGYAGVGRLGCQHIAKEHKINKK